uniref:Metallothionein n=1 Tax=Pseudonaja textilis TaxID=8673 RepID=A0A670Y7L1_PSETE
KETQPAVFKSGEKMLKKDKDKRTIPICKNYNVFHTKPSCSSCHPASTNNSAKGCVCKEFFSDKCHSCP